MSIVCVGSTTGIRFCSSHRPSPRHLSRITAQAVTNEPEWGLGWTRATNEAWCIWWGGNAIDAAHGIGVAQLCSELVYNELGAGHGNVEECGVLCMGWAATVAEVKVPGSLHLGFIE